MNSLPTKLNLGCGSIKYPDFLNVDIDPAYNPDMILDLSKVPYPFPDNHFEYIVAEHVIEHLDDVFAVMQEIYRISKPGAEILIRVPHFSRGFTCPDHKRGFGTQFPHYFDPAGHNKVKLEPIRVRLHWVAMPHARKKMTGSTAYYFYRGLGAIIDFLANLAPNLWSRLLCYYVGGFEEIEFRFKVVKG